MYPPSSYLALFLFLAVLFAQCQANQNSNEDEATPRTGLPRIDELSDRIKNEPQNPELYFLRAQAYAEHDFEAEAVRDGEKALSLDSTQAVYYEFLADAYLDNNQSRPAIKLLEYASTRFPQNTQIWQNLSEINLLVEAYDQALIAIDQYLKLKPADSEGLFLKGQIYKYSGDTSKAIEFYQQTVEQNSDHLNAYIQLATLMELFNQSVALKYLDNALRIDSSNYDALFLLAQYYHYRGQFEPAIKAYERLILAHPMNANPHYNLGLLYMEQKQYTQARESFDRSTKFNVQFELAYYFRGEAAERLGDKAAAQKDYEQALKIQPNLQLAIDGLKRLKTS